MKKTLNGKWQFRKVGDKPYKEATVPGCYDTFFVNRCIDEAKKKRLETVKRARELEAQGISSLERDFLRFQADLPLHYVRREDYVRGQSIVEAKLDGLATKIDNAQLRASMNERGSP